jgi:suppressor of ftsI
MQAPSSLLLAPRLLWRGLIVLAGAALAPSLMPSAKTRHGMCPLSVFLADTLAITPGPSPSLFCIDLVPVPGLKAVSGVAELRRAMSPFTVAVDSEGHHRFQVDLMLRGLPHPSKLGPYTAYVAWATTLDFAEQLKLGEVRDGWTSLPPVSFNKYILMITAEASPSVTERKGRMMLRATSPSWYLLPHDGSKLPARSDGGGGHDHDGRGGWVMPAMHPQVPWMVAGLESLQPAVAPWLPGAGVDSNSIPMVQSRQLVTLRDGDSLDLVAGLVRRTIAGRPITMYGFNGQSPGPLIRVPQRAKVVVNFTNHLDQPTSIHWHGVRLDNRFDGVPNVTQEPVPPGGRFRYEVRFPDAGIYWYHSHQREDTQQDLGLYGNLFVHSPSPGYFGKADREEVLMLDDLLLAQNGSPVPYGADAATHALMGRFGNVLLVNGANDYSLHVHRGEVVRFYFTNASNVRVFNVTLGGARLKLVGSDIGKFEREQWVHSVVIAPAERYIVEARFDNPGTVALANHVQAIDHMSGRFFSEVDTLGQIVVDDTPVAHRTSDFDRLRTNLDVKREINRYRALFSRAPDKTLLLTLDEAKTLPYGVIQMLRLDSGYVNPVEWSGTMPMMDWLATSKEVRWMFRDLETAHANMEIGWRFKVGDVIKLRLINNRHTLHAMQHPIHIHGQRFLVIAVNGDTMQTLGWKDTVLVPAGSVVDLLVEMTNPGTWMLHCHIAEHLQAGMHTVFEVTKR